MLTIYSMLTILILCFRQVCRQYTYSSYEKMHFQQPIIILIMLRQCIFNSQYVTTMHIQQPICYDNAYSTANMLRQCIFNRQYLTKMHIQSQYLTTVHIQQPISYENAHSTTMHIQQPISYDNAYSTANTTTLTNATVQVIGTDFAHTKPDRIMQPSSITGRSNASRQRVVNYTVQ